MEQQELTVLEAKMRRAHMLCEKIGDIRVCIEEIDSKSPAFATIAQDLIGIMPIEDFRQGLRSMATAYLDKCRAELKAM